MWYVEVFEILLWARWDTAINFINYVRNIWGTCIFLASLYIIVRETDIYNEFSIILNIYIIEYIYIINIIWSLRNLFLFTLIILIQFMNNCSLLGMQNIYKKKHKSHSYDSNYYAKIFSIKIYWNYEILYILWEKFYLKVLCIEI